MLWTCEEAGLGVPAGGLRQRFKPWTPLNFSAWNPTAWCRCCWTMTLCSGVEQYLPLSGAESGALGSAARAAARRRGGALDGLAGDRVQYRLAPCFMGCVKILAFRIRRRLKRVLPPDPLRAHCRGAAARTGAWIAGERFTLADIVLGLSVHRWKMTPFRASGMPAVERWYMALNQRPAFMRHGNNGVA